MKKKLLAIIAVMAMVVAMVPSMVFADATYVAEVGGDQYPSLQEAIDAAKDGAVITVLKDIDLTNTDLELLDGSYNTYFMVEGKSVTVDLNGKTISGGYAKTDRWLVGVFSTDNNGHLTLTGNGTVDVTTADGCTVYSLIANYEEGCSITIENGTYKLDKAKDCLVYSGASHDPDKNEGIEVKGGTFVLENVGAGTNGQPWIFNVLKANERHVWVTGGTFNDDVHHQHWVFEVQGPNDKALKDNGDGTWTTVDAVAYVDEWENTGTWKKEVGYATLEEAVEAANTRGTAEKANKEGEKITLLKDCKISDTLLFAKDTEIELNGNKIIWEGKDSTPIVSLDEGVTLNEFEPSREGYEFKGWYTDANYESEWNWDFESIGSQTRATQEVINLYAKWEEDPVEPTIPGGEAAPDDTAVPEEPAEEPADEVDTGDNMNMAIPFGIAGLALAAMAAVVATRRRAN